MAKKVAPPKLTGGGGFGFEDQVAAYFLSCLLIGRPPLDPALGIISRIDFQTRVDGWYLDDILLTLLSAGVSRQCALSVKSNQQFTSKRAPAEFVSLAWEQFLHEGTTKFEKSRDKLGLITAPFNQHLQLALSRLLEMASRQDSKDLPRRLMTPRYAQIRALFKTFSCPPDLAKNHGITEESVGELLQRIQILPFDFELQTSSRRIEAVQNCQNALISGSVQEADQLWGTLLTVAAKYRPSSGSLDLPHLLDLLRARFGLKASPNHEHDWDRLSQQTQNNLFVVPDKIGQLISLPRETELAELEKAFEVDRVTVLIGPSGCGKTVLAKLWVEKQLRQSRVLWLNGRSFDVPDFATFERGLGLTNPFQELLISAPDSRAWVVIDGVDRVASDFAFQNMSLILGSLRMGSQDSAWRVLITCQPEEWERIQHQFARSNSLPSKWKIFNIADPSIEQLAAVWKDFPSLAPLTLRHDLRSLLCKPKILDLLANHISAGGSVDATKWLGESDLIDWFWGLEISKAPDSAMRAGFVMKLAERQADGLESATPLSHFPVSELAPVDSLVKDRICVRTVQERILFYHDLYGDWARQRLLLSRANALKEYLEPRVDSPLWYRAIRLYGLQLLERSPDSKRWREAFQALGSNDGNPTLAQDLLLESAIFAANPLPILERMWPDLAANRGILLRRLLGRFLYVATLPNPALQIMSKIFGSDLETHAATLQRLPYWPYWLSMLTFLHNHRQETVQVAPMQIAELSDIWLRRGYPSWLLRKEAAELAVATAESIFEFKHGDGICIVTDHTDENAYHAALAGSAELPEQVAAFALKASGRRPPRPEEDNQSEAKKSLTRRTLRVSVVETYSEETPPAWSEGPHWPVDTAFRDTCIKSDALHPLILANPIVAREVILALLIEEARPRRRYDPTEDVFNGLGIEYLLEFYPPFYTSGPFSFFLQNHPDEGLTLILTLVNFATERWADRWKNLGRTPPQIQIAHSFGSKNWVGSFQVYYWYRQVDHCPHAVAAALMALEKWLYDQIDAKKPLDHAIDRILHESSSVAFAGVLNAVGCMEPALFQRLLKPLLEPAEFHDWELAYSDQFNLSVQALMAGWWNKGDVFIKLARKWHTLPHRSHGLHEWAMYLFLNFPEMRAFFAEVRSGWQARLNAKDTGGVGRAYLNQLVARYDVNNYKEETTAQGQEVWAYHPPQAVQEENEAALKRLNDEALLWQLPLRSIRILKGQDTLKPEEINGFWSNLERVSLISASDEETQNRVRDGVSGGAAVLLVFHRDWLEKVPGRLEWCKKQVLQPVTSAPWDIKTREFYLADSTWETSCARAISALWAESPDSVELREAVSALVMRTNYKAVATLFYFAASSRDKLRRDFGQLQYFLFCCSAAQWAIHRAKQYDPLMKNEAEQSLQLEVKEWLVQRRKSFIEGSLSTHVSNWKDFEMRDKLPKRNVHAPPKSCGDAPLLDLWLIRAAFSWLPAMAEATSEAERAEWIEFWKQALSSTVRLLKAAGNDDGEISGTPDEWERWVFSRMAPLIVSLRPQEKAEDFWSPILELGGPAHYWIDDFFVEWFQNGLRNEPNQAAFLREWKKMVEFAFSLPTWDASSVRRSYLVDRIWCYILGFNRHLVELWSESAGPVIAEMQSYYKRWAETFLVRPDCAIPFIVFLTNPAAEVIRLEALDWIAKAVLLPESRFWTERNAKENLASLLDFCWQPQSEPLRQNPIAFDAFKKLLVKLAEFQNPLALELQQRVATGK